MVNHTLQRVVLYDPDLEFLELATEALGRYAQVKVVLTVRELSAACADAQTVLALVCLHRVLEDGHLQGFAKLPMRVPRVGLAPCASEDIEAFALEAGLDDVIRAPISARLLRRKLRSFVSMVAPLARVPVAVRQALADVPTWCEACSHAVVPTDDRCHSCSAPRPDSGWPLIAETDHVHLGRRVGNYRLDRYLGGGSTATVYRGVECTIGHRVALKVLRLGPTQLLGPDGIKGEARHTAAIQSPYVVSIRDVFSIDLDYIAVVMDYVPGLASNDMVEECGPLPYPVAVSVTRQIAEGLHAAHRLGLVHRDIKPQNILVHISGGQRPHAKLIDFGFADLIAQASTGSRFIGTPMYAAPEQFRSPTKVGAHTDVYGLCGVLYFLLTGLAPFDGNGLMEIAVKKLSEPVPELPLEVADSEIRASLNAILQRGLAPDPSDRFDSARELIVALDELDSAPKPRSSFRPDTDPEIANTEDQIRASEHDLDAARLALGAFIPASEADAARERFLLQETVARIQDRLRRLRSHLGRLRKRAEARARRARQRES